MQVFANVVTSPISNWQPFYALMGTGAATLLGLVFVAMSLRHNMDFARSISVERSIWSAGSISLASFANLFIISLAFMVPDQTIVTLGLILIILGGVASISTIVLLIVRKSGLNRQTLVLATLAPCCFMLQCAFAVLLILGYADLLDWLALVLSLLLLDALLVSWILLAVPLFMRMQQQKSE